MEKALSQADEIKAIYERMGITRDELAERVPMNPETLRKIAGGHQSASDRMMNSIRAVEKMSRFMHDHPTNSRMEALSPYRLMDPGILQSNFADLAQRLKKTAPHDRKHVLGNLRAMLDELEERELSSKDLTSMQRLAKSAVDPAGGRD